MQASNPEHVQSTFMANYLQTGCIFVEMLFFMGKAVMDGKQPIQSLAVVWGNLKAITDVKPIAGADLLGHRLQPVLLGHCVHPSATGTSGAFCCLHAGNRDGSALTLWSRPATFAGLNYVWVMFGTSFNDQVSLLPAASFTAIPLMGFTARQGC